MTRALALFTVRHGALRLRVRLLPGVREVDRSYRSGSRRRAGIWIHAYAEPARRSDARHQCTLVLPADGRLTELVPHEVAHAVMHHLVEVHRDEDEPLATAIGILTARILARLRRLGLEVA